MIAIKTRRVPHERRLALVPALIDCAEHGKQAVCLVELKARFDERRNIEWSRALEQAGVHVVYGFPELKIHAKMTLIVRREGDGLRRYVHIGTGNYHATTARLYEDVGIFTADEDIAADVADLFNYLTGFGRPQRFRKLLVAPFALRTASSRRSARSPRPRGRRARAHPAQDEPARRPGDDRGAVRGVSQAGARVEICARAHLHAPARASRACRETIHVRSIVGRFLEHSRIFAFEAGERRDLHRQRRPDAAQPRPAASRCSRRSRTRAARQELGPCSTASSPTTLARGRSTATARGARASPQASEAQHHQAAMMRRAQLRARRQTDGSAPKSL